MGRFMGRTGLTLAVMASKPAPRRRKRGEVEVLPNGSIRVRVYAGVDPITGKRHRLEEVIPAGTPNASKLAEEARTRLLSQVDERRNVKTSATVGQLVARYLELIKVEPTTMYGYRSVVDKHVLPLLGDVKLGRINGEVLDSFYKELRRCRIHCKGRGLIDHRSTREHECDDRCGPHKCKPLGDGTLRKIDAILRGAGKRAVRWGWLGVNPFAQTEPILAHRPNPNPPTPEQAAAIVNEAFTDLDWGLFVWLAMVTGARRGELCALAWDRLDADAGVLTIRTSIAQRGRETWEKPTKTHQQRRITVDDQTLMLLVAYRKRCAERSGLDDMPDSARIFSPMPDGSEWLRPDTVGQRYARMCARLGWDMNLHQLRHYSATELISSGVDVRTVAGRLGHGGGGTTTLRVYTAWVAEADQRAAGKLAGRMPTLPTHLAEGDLQPVERVDDSSPYKAIAADLRAAIRLGALSLGDRLPTFSALAERYGVSFGTAQRAVALLKSQGLVTVQRGRRAVVASPRDGEQLADVINLR